MSRVTRSKIEKTKVKVVFRLQFYATHIPQSGWDKLFITLIPADTGKAPAKTTKANVRNGSCKWTDPIYETTRLLQDNKTRQYDEKLYTIIVGMGSSRSSMLGEANINLADFVDALKPTAVTLPLNGCKAGILHVTVQLLTSKTGFREFERQREFRERGLQTTFVHGNPDESAHSKESSHDQNVNNRINKINARVKFKKESTELPGVSSLEGEAGGNEEYADSALGLGFDGSSTTSASLHAEMHDMSSTHEVDSLKRTIYGDSRGLPLSQSPRPEKQDASHNQFPSRSIDWVHDWRVDYSAANNTASASEDNSNNRLKGNLEAVESSILDLKLEVNSLQHYVDEIGIETQNFAEQLSAEISSGEELLKDIAGLKLECSKFKDDFEKLESYKLSLAYTTSEPTWADKDKLFQKLQPKWIKGLLFMEDKLRDMQKLSMGLHERDSRVLNSEIEALVEILQDLKQESGQPILGINVANGRESKQIDIHIAEKFLTGLGSDADSFQPQGMAHYLSIPGLPSHESEEKIYELLRELDESKTEREILLRKMDQMECYYEALIQELEQNQRQMMAELQNLRNEHSTCLYTISSSKTEMEKMHQNMNDKILKFTEDKHVLDSLNNELERRAISAEAALKKARLNYSIALGQLQNDLELLSCQVLSMYETNENLIKQAFSDSPISSPEPKYLKNSEGPTSNQFLFQNWSFTFNKQHFGEDMLLRDLKNSLQLQEGLYKQVEEEVYQMHFGNICLDVFSKALQETLLEASLDFQSLKEEIDQRSQQLQITTESNNSLMLRLQNAMNDIHSLNECKEICTAKCNDIAHQNQILGADLKNFALENIILTEKINELEALMTEYRSFEGKYTACSIENSELKNLLRKESLENGHLHDEISNLQEEINSTRTKSDELASMNDNLQSVVSSLSNKLQKLLSSYDDEYSEISLCSRSACGDSEFKDLEGLLLRLEELQQSACDSIQLLIEEKKVLVNEKHMAQVSLNTAQSDSLITKQKFEHDLLEMVGNLSVSNTLLQKLQSEFEVVVNKVKAGSDAEGSYSQLHQELLSSLDHLEAEAQQLSCRNQDLAQEILRLDTLSSDLEMCKVTLASITEEKAALELLLQEKTAESAKILSELKSLHSLQEELHAERTIREKMEKTVTYLTSELNEKQCQLQDSNMNRKNLKQLVAELEFENSRISDLLWQSEERVKDALRVSSPISCLDTHFSELHEYSIATDVIMIFTRAQFEGHMEELVEKLHSSRGQLDVLYKENLDVESELNGCRSRELICTEENTRLLTSLDSLKSELEATTAQNRALIDENSAILSDLKKHKSRIENVDNSYVNENWCAHEVARLEHLMANCNREIEDLFLSKEEVEIISVVLMDKLDELETSLKVSDADMIRMQNQCNDLTKRLSEKTSKTEEFKNLSIHLKEELKYKAEANFLKAHDRRGHEGGPVAMQDSLGFAFKEQYETKPQELKQKLSLSKSHSEEMLLKLQDAIDETENRKKSEAYQMKRNEELEMKIMDLKAELQAVLSVKFKLLNAYDLVNSEMECSVISLECCKQEKQEPETSFLKCDDEKSKISLELPLTKEFIKTSRSHVNLLNEGNGPLQKITSSSNDPVEGKLHATNSVSDIATTGTEIEHQVLECNSSLDPFFNSLNPQEEKSTCMAFSEEPENTGLLINMPPKDPNVGTEEDLQQNEGKMHAALTESLKSSIDHLNKELERMKNENLLPPVDDRSHESRFPGLQREIMQLQEANQELGNIFPVFNEIFANGNALERVLALEIELAEALQAKKKSSIQFQSSFLKQHWDEEAIFRCFRDINELIKDMLELRTRNAAVETELKEMHDRYTQLSLQLAEVEGERQKLKMTLKNTRASKKL